MARWQRGPGCLPGGSQLLPAKAVPHPFRTGAGAELAVVLSAWVVLALLEFLWLSLDKRPLAWDQAHHFLLSLRYLEALGSPLTWPDIFSVAIKYPYLFHLGLAKLFWFTGVSLRFAAGVNLFWLLVLMLALWLLGRRAFGGWAGVWAAVLCAAAPASVGLDRVGFIREPRPVPPGLGAGFGSIGRLGPAGQMDLSIICSCTAGFGVVAGEKAGQRWP